MGAFNIFTWSKGATFGTFLATALGGNRVGEDSLGNIYYESGKARNGVKRRWVMYKGSTDASLIAPEWTGWLRGQIDALPQHALPAPRAWQRAPTANLTGTNAAHRPSGALEAGGQRKPATGDYEAWTPDAP